MNTRALAASVLAEVVEGHQTLTLALEKALAGIAQENDRALVKALCYGVSRWYFRLGNILDTLTAKPIKDAEIRLLALVGLYQLHSMRVKPYAAVAETVAAAGRKAWAKPLLNAVLRRYQREADAIENSLDATTAEGSAHPNWLYRRLQKDWPENLHDLLAANNVAPPMVLRVNLARTNRADYLEKLAAAGIIATPCRIADSGIVLEQPIPVTRLPGFAEGEVSVQDEAAQLAAGLLRLAPHQRVLDVCAAPGGKTLHILETCTDLAEVVAVDVEPGRLGKISENLQRSNLTATLIVGDAAQPKNWWDGSPFDRVLVDAPCSATGVIRRHPDIKIRRQSGDIDDLTQLQRRILDASWNLLAPGGLLVYATCSVLRRENEQQIDAFLQRHADAHDLAITADWGLAVSHGRQILTGSEGMDGFFYACLEKPVSCSPA